MAVRRTHGPEVLLPGQEQRRSLGRPRAGPGARRQGPSRGSEPVRRRRGGRRTGAAGAVS
ncbi:hypothetical protein [Actinomycetospora succinea]|uniref:hypothetical protein n=1 Tax=Actinomycetospora succinea TaxID=663603 RepID=UPI00105FCADA|nr:hypothetical protein [Actinomycetospora succinea]